MVEWKQRFLTWHGNFDLSNNNIGDEGARGIAASLTGLTWLYLWKNSIGVEGAKALLDVWSSEQRRGRLVHLDLRENGDLSELLWNEVLAGGYAPGILAAYRWLTVKDSVLRGGEFWL